MKDPTPGGRSLSRHYATVISVEGGALNVTVDGIADAVESAAKTSSAGVVTLSYFLQTTDR
jgi:hypothetical protein